MNESYDEERHRSAVGHYEKALACLQAGRFMEAMSEFGLSEKIYVANEERDEAAKVWEKRSAILEEKGMNREAGMDLHFASNQWYFHGRALAKAAPPRVTEAMESYSYALELLDKSIALNPTDPLINSEREKIFRAIAALQNP